MSLKHLLFLSRSFFEKVQQALLDAFFPLFCLGCRTYGTSLCKNCLSTFPIRLKQRCPTCMQSPTPHGEVCFSCAGKNALDGLFAGSIYRSPLISHTIHTFKYQYISHLAPILGEWLAERVRNTELPLPDLILPVPLHTRRLRFRGFNQSFLIARALGETLAPGLDTLVAENVLLRTRYTTPQMKTKNKEERLKNLTGAFSIKKEKYSLIQGKSFWLVDDVSTTGTTLEECALVLKKAGAKNVFGIVFAR